MTKTSNTDNRNSNSRKASKNTQSFDSLFDELAETSEEFMIPTPEEPARAQAIANANSAFDQAFTDTDRPKTKSTDSFLRSLIMSIFSKKPLGHGFSYAFGAIAMVAIAVPIILSYNSGPVPTQVVTPPLTGNDDHKTAKAEHRNLPTMPESDMELEEVTVTTAQPSEQNIEREAVGDIQAIAPVTAKANRPEAIASRPRPNKSRLSAEKASEGKTRRIEALRENFSQAQDQVGFAPEQGAAHQKLSHVQPTFSDSSSSAPIRPDLGEEYSEYQRNKIVQVTDEPVSTFSADVDTASYSLARNQINRGLLPAQQAVRPEEFINYFNYDYPMAESKSQPFKPTVSVLDSPWNEGRKLIHIGIKGYDIEPEALPDSNIVFLIDVSGSMNAQNKLPLAKQSIFFLLNQLKPTDNVSIAVYAGAAGVVLEPTEVKEKNKIMSALGKLNAGGSTAGGAGIELAYSLAQQNFDSEAVNRIVLLTDGDFNVGQSSNRALLELVERKRKSGVFLSVLGFGRNNYQDDMMQTLAQNGNGIATYIDTLHEAKKVMVDEATSSLFPIAKDVKFQVEFNPSAVTDYRLIGYETRVLNTEDFNNDKVDAGDIGAGHTVTAIYEITPRGSKAQSVDTPRYAENRTSVDNTKSKNEYGFLKIRYKLPNEDKSKLLETAISVKQSEPSGDATFSIAVAGFSQLLNGDTNTGKLTMEDVAKMAKAYRGSDNFGYRTEFIQLVEMAGLLQKN